MEAGQKLDILIGERIMGWRHLSHGVFEYYFEHVYVSCVPKFSTDLAAAWQVVEKLAGDDGDYSFRLNNFDGDWVADFFDNEDGPHKATADTACLAICFAALKAAGVSIE